MGALRERGVDVAVVDTQLPAGRARSLRKALRCLRAAGSIGVRPPVSVIVVASGGAGLLSELVPIVVATRLRRLPVHLVHHSSSYIRTHSTLLATVLRLAGPRLGHVALSEGMRIELAERYGIARDDVTVVGNIGLMPAAEPADPGVRPARGLVHVSNLSVEKGSVVAIDVGRRTGERLVLAGPATAEVRAAIEQARSAGQMVEWLGPVEGPSKDDAVASARVFVFPSSYEHEAQPLVLYEAARLGTVPIAWANGWIPEQMAELGLERNVFAVGDIDGVVTAVRAITMMSDAAFADLSDSVRASFARTRSASSPALDRFAVALGEAGAPK